MIEIRYIKNGIKDPNFLGISVENREELDKIKLCYETDLNITVNIFTGSIKKEMKNDKNIRQD